jgi:hypothetical protein
MTRADVQQFATIIVAVFATVFAITMLSSCEEDFFGRPPDAYSQLR